MDPLTDGSDAGPVIGPDNPARADVHALLTLHLEMMRKGSPPESCHVMDPGALVEAGVTLVSARMGGTLVGVGALKPLDATHGELKSMHVAQAGRGRGVGRALLRALLARASKGGLQRVSLETGRTEMFAAARTLYAAHGFEECPPFGDYRPDPFSVFMTRAL